MPPMRSHRVRSSFRSVEGSRSTTTTPIPTATCRFGSLHLHFYKHTGTSARTRSRARASTNPRSRNSRFRSWIGARMSFLFSSSLQVRLPLAPRIVLKPYAESLSEDMKFGQATPSADNDLVKNFVKPHLLEHKESPALGVGEGLCFWQPYIQLQNML